MGTAALTKPTTGFLIAKKVIGSQLVNQDNILRLVLPLENGGDPTSAITPDFIGQLCVDTTNSNAYIAMTAASSGWTKIN